MPTRRIRSAGCARTASGQERQDAAALQSSVINSRRFIASPEALDKASYQVEFAMSALGQKRTLDRLLDHLVGGQKNAIGYSDAKCLGRF